MTARVVSVLIFAVSLLIFADEKPKPPPKKKPPKKQLPPVWLTKAEDPKSPTRPFARGIYTTEAEWLPLFKPTGKLATELKGLDGQVHAVAQACRKC